MAGSTTEAGQRWPSSRRGVGWRMKEEPRGQSTALVETADAIVPMSQRHQNSPTPFSHSASCSEQRRGYDRMSTEPAQDRLRETVKRSSRLATRSSEVPTRMAHTPARARSAQREALLLINKQGTLTDNLNRFLYHDATEDNRGFIILG